MRISSNDNYVEINPGYAETPDAAAGALVLAGNRVAISPRTLDRSTGIGRDTAQVPADVKSDSSSQKIQDRLELRQANQPEVDTRQYLPAYVARAVTYAPAAPLYEYRLGSDGRLYTVGGEVSVDVRLLQGNPESEVPRRNLSRQAPLAAARDYSIASRNSYEVRRIRTELMREQRQKIQQDISIMAVPKGMYVDTWV